MNRKQIKAELKGLKGQLRAVNRVNDTRLLKLTFVLILLLIAAAVLYNTIGFIKI